MKENKNILNCDVIELLKFLEKPIIDEKNVVEKHLFKGEGEVCRLPMPITTYTNTKTDFQGNIIAKFRTINKLKIGIDEKNYGKLLNVCENIYRSINISKLTTQEFVEEKIFDWLIERYIYNTKIEPIEYLKNEIDKISSISPVSRALSAFLAFKIGKGQFKPFASNVEFASIVIIFLISYILLL